MKLHLGMLAKKKAHILSPGDRGWGGGNIEVVSKSQNMSFFFGHFMKKKSKYELFFGAFYEKKRKQKSSFSGFWRHRVGGGRQLCNCLQETKYELFLQLSLKRYYQLTTGTYKNELQSL